MTSREQLVTRALDEVNRHAGLFFKDVRLVGAVETVTDWLAEHGIVDPTDIGPGVALDALLEDLVVHESYFDRDLEQLRLVDELVLAELARTTAPIRIWSAGCASGEEAYTLAFMLEARGLLPRTTIAATDLSRPALERARAGRYRSWAVRAGGTSPAMRYLVRTGTDWCVPERIRTSVAFATLNLVEDPFPHEQDLIVCRNVLIYLDPTAIAVVARKLAGALAPDGWLFVAPSDPRLDPHAPLAATITDRGVYYRRADLTTEIAPRPDGPASTWVPPLPRLPPAPPPPRAMRRVSTTVPPAPKPQTEAARDRARVLADRGDREGARSVLAAAIVTTPLDAELHFLEAVLAAPEDVRASLASLDRVIYLCPDAPLTYLFAARLQQSRGDRVAARRSYARAQQLLDASAPDDRVLWSDEPAWLMADACRRALASLS